MNTLIYNTAASEGGAAAILRLFHQNAVDNKDQVAYFVVGEMALPEYSNVKVLRFPQAKRSRMFRCMLELFYLPWLIRRLKIERVVSLQNTAIPFCPVPQTVYMHNCLPFIDVRFGFFQNRSLWINQNVAGLFMKKAIRVADRLIVQTQWMKEACQRAVSVSSEKFVLETPTVNYQQISNFQETADHYKVFFYPASGFVFKNHRVIVEACRLLVKQAERCDFRVIFTLTGDETPEISALREIALAERLPIDFIGTVSPAEVFCYYSKSVLLFASYAETCGLPLLEAKASRTPIIAADWAVPREVLADYERVVWFDFNSPLSLARQMEYMIGFAK